MVARFNAKSEILEFQPLHDSLPVTSAAAPVAYVDPISGSIFFQQPENADLITDTRMSN